MQRLVTPYSMLCTSLFLFMSFYFLLLEDREAFATCNKHFYVRSQNPDKLGTASISPSVRNFLFFWVVRTVVASLGVLLLYQSYARNYNKIVVLASLVVLVGGYFVGIAIAEELKRISGDLECNVKPNGVSGHSFYGVWAIGSCLFLCELIIMEIDLASRHEAKLRNTDWTKKPNVRRVGDSFLSNRERLCRTSLSGEQNLQYSWEGNSSSGLISPSSALMVHSKRKVEREKEGELQPLPDERRMRALLKLFVVLIVALPVSIQLWFTYYYSYHTVQQMVLGACTGLLWLSFSISVCDAIRWLGKSIWWQQLRRRSSKKKRE